MNMFTLYSRRIANGLAMFLLLGANISYGDSTATTSTTKTTTTTPMVHFISLSSAYSEVRLPKIIDTFQDRGYQVSSRYLNQFVSDLGYVNIDEVRAQNLIDALLDDQVDILWVVRGGGGALNLLPYLMENLEQLKKAKPKTLVGYSDITAVHLFISKYLPHWRSVHGLVANYSQEMDTDANKTNINDLEPIPNIPLILQRGVTYSNLLPMNALALKGVQGNITGGNLELVRSTFGTDYSPDFAGKILLIEDVGITYRQLDRMLNQLLLHNDMQQVNAILVGQLYPLRANEGERLIFKRAVELFAKRFQKPVYYFPNIGHGRKNHPIILGQETVITCDQDVYCDLTQERK